MKTAAAHSLARAAIAAWTDSAAAVARGMPADAALRDWLRARRELGSRDRRFIGEALFSRWRWHGWVARASLSDPCALALAYLLDAAQPHPAATALIGTERPVPEPAGAVAVEQKAAMFTAWAGTEVALPHLVPSWFIDAVDPSIDRPRLLASFQERPPTWLRMPDRTREPALKLLAENKAVVREDHRLHGAYALAAPLAAPLLDALAALGVQVQDWSSQCVGAACAPQPGERWLDACAGAGGKTLQLAESLQQRGGIVATDLRADALARLRERAARASLQHIETRPASQPLPRHHFDGILLDAPCSGTGTWNRNPDARWRTTPAQLEAAARTQRDLLATCAPALKPNGRLLFAVCSITQVETSHTSPTPLSPAPPTCPHGQPLRQGTLLLPADGPGIGMYFSTLKYV